MRKLLVLILLCICSGCRSIDETSSSSSSQDTASITYPPIVSEHTTIPQVENEPEAGIKKEEEAAMKEYVMVINGVSFDLTLYENETTKVMKEKLPMTITMDDLHGNEKFHYLNESLPTKSEMVQTIEEGDLMLFGSDCLVLFYDNFTTSYSYTKLGKLNDPSSLSEVIHQNKIEVTIHEGENK